MEGPLRSRWLPVLLAVAASTASAWWLLAPSDERVVAERLALLAEVVSRDGKDKLAFVGKARTLDELLAMDAVLVLPGRGHREELVGLQRLKGLYLQTLQAAPVAEVRLRDVTVTVDGDAAVATFTAETTTPGADGRGALDARELRTTWRRTPDGWLVARVEPVDVFR